MKNKKNFIRKYIQIFLSICIVMLINLSYSTEKVKINLGDVNMLNSFLQIIGINYIIGIIWKKEKGKKLIYKYFPDAKKKIPYRDRESLKFSVLSVLSLIPQ